MHFLLLLGCESPVPADVGPDACIATAELCDGQDNDCDGLVDLDDPDTIDTIDVWSDRDGDGYGSASADPERACAVASGFSAVSGDCTDWFPAIHPGAVEVCDGDDNDCDGLVDGEDTYDATTVIVWYPDADGDGYGGSPVVSCSEVDGFEPGLPPGDCDDTRVEVHPGATDVCDGVDDDCDGSEAGCVPVVGASVGLTVEADGDRNGVGGIALVPDEDPSRRGSILAGFPRDETAGTNYYGGAVYLLRAPTEPGRISDLETASWYGTRESTMGEMVADAGDTDGDGLRDMLAADFQYDRGCGCYHQNVSLLRNGRDTIGAEPDWYLSIGDNGESLVGNVDLVNNDERPDLAVAIWLGVWIYDGTAIDPDTDGTHASIDQDDATAIYGTVAAGDWDGDGRADLVVAARHVDFHDALLLFSGPFGGSRAAGDAEAIVGGGAVAMSSGVSLVPLADFDGDGIEDLGLASELPVGAHLLSLATPPEDLDDAPAILSVREEEGPVSIASAGDLDGDGRGDVLLGAPDSDVGGDEAGAVWIIPGATRGAASLDAAWRVVTGPYPGANIGAAVAGGADLNADGMPDLATNLASVSTSGAEQPPGLLFVSGNSL